MQLLYDGYIAIRDFMELGGPVLNAIALVILLMWILIVERILYFRTVHSQRVVAEHPKLAPARQQMEETIRLGGFEPVERDGRFVPQGSR